jgi:hypothetical protein
MRDDREANLAMKRRRRRARRVTFLLALVCAIVGLALGAFQLQAEGLNQFLYRAPGVGASK